MRRTLLPLAALALVLVAGGCKVEINGGATPGPGGTTVPSDSPVADPPFGDGSSANDNVSPPAAPPAKVPALTCDQVAESELGSTKVRYNNYPDPIPLTEGRWAGEDGVVVALQPPCATGDLTGDGAADALRAIMLDGGGTGKFWGIVLWRNVKGAPAYVGTVDLGDRTPIEKITISAGQAQVVYLTRPDDASMVELVIERTATYRLIGDKLEEIGYVDKPHS
ncbi:hypothetical protein [Micromonospora peucetia]|uniref:Lipoprotein n=1 Tax=Micromonospora peucetia TaxID=47871 RepID=A0A1C6VZD4_9ACTN|nr:hypothetical protein [Micromonospora peucetia]WSA31682.1 hypothetical protein OIE14_26740 [Micromonospora peucetia]SCL71668.1 hypothetical protein GA0070608_4716 [Micromonospora peucetia]